MQIDIKPIHCEGVNCFDDILVTLAVHNKIEYRDVFSKAWGFELLPANIEQNELLGNRIRNSVSNYANLISIGCNIKWTNFNFAEPKELFKFITGYLDQGIPMGICFDCFYCPWLQGRYKRVHGTHYCLAIGTDDDNNFYCIDPSLNFSVSTLEYDDFINGSKHCIKYDIAKKDESIDYLGILNESIESLKNSKFYIRIKDFANEFKTNFNFTAEYQNFEISVWNVLIDRNLRLIAAGRTLYAQFLDLVSEKLPSYELSVIKNELKIAASKWNKLRGILTKCYYAEYDEKVMKKVYDALIEVSNYEENLINKLYECSHTKQLSNNKNISPIAKDIVLSGNSQIIALDLENLLSNKAFALSEFDTFRADLTGTGMFFIFDGLEKKNSIQVEEMYFELPKFMNRYDNIACSGEIITVEKSIYYSIMFLGCCEHGDFVDEVIIRFENGEIHKIPISFSDCWRLPLFNEAIAWTGPGGRWTDNKYEPHSNIQRIFAREELIVVQEPIESIKLPDCPNMHIFSISLRKLI